MTLFQIEGYKTNKSCDICGGKPCVLEPRFLYTTCAVHSNLSPVDFSNKVCNRKTSTKDSHAIH